MKYMKFIKIENRKIFMKILIILFIYLLNINIFQLLKIYFIYIYSDYQIKNVKSYLNYLNSDKSKLIKSFKICNFPKVSIISPVFNRERYLSRFIRSIQYQNFNDIEIILVNDCSSDNSVNIIETFRKKDKRIKVINLKKNKGTFVTRNIGVLFAKGKYIILPDSDDIISKSIINICYKHCEKYKYEMLKFHLYFRNKYAIIKQNLLYENKPIYQPELSTKLFYRNDELYRNDFSICNKFMKREIYIKTINSINSFYLNQYIINCEDQILNFMLYRTAKSLYNLKVVGYYYIKTSISISRNVEKISELNNIFRFIYLKIIFENTKNNKYEKDMCNHLLSFTIDSINLLKLSLIDINNYKFYNNIIDMYLNNDFITYDNKIILNNLKDKLNKLNKQLKI